jgi:hypothetical protein
VNAKAFQVSAITNDGVPEVSISHSLFRSARPRSGKFAWGVQDAGAAASILRLAAIPCPYFQDVTTEPYEPVSRIGFALQSIEGALRWPK